MNQHIAQPDEPASAVQAESSADQGGRSARRITRPAASAIKAGIIGNYVDQIHIFLPVVALAPALSTIAGPDALANVAAIVIMATLIGRSVGAFVFGHLADRWGRTTTTQIAILGTAACTLTIGLVPSHLVLGGATIMIIVAARFLGGVFLAGEYSAAIPLAMEWSKPHQRGLVSGAIMSMAPLAQSSIAGFTAVGLMLAGSDAYATWGWRIGFIAGAMASMGVLYFYRRRVKDHPAVMSGAPAQPVDQQAAPQPAAQGTQRSIASSGVIALKDLLFGHYARVFWQMFGLMSGMWCMTQMVVILIVPRLKTDVGLSDTYVSLVMMAASLGQAVGMVFAGQLSTWMGRRRFFIAWGLVAMVCGPIMWGVIMHSTSAFAAGLGAMALQLLTVPVYGPVGAYLAEGFSADIRSAGYGTAYSLSIVIPALYPFYIGGLESLFGHLGGPMCMLAIGGALVAGCAALGPSADRGMAHD